MCARVLERELEPLFHSHPRFGPSCLGGKSTSRSFRLDGGVSCSGRFGAGKWVRCTLWRNKANPMAVCLCMSVLHEKNSETIKAKRNTSGGVEQNKKEHTFQTKLLLREHKQLWRKTEINSQKKGQMGSNLVGRNVFPLQFYCWLDGGTESLSTVSHSGSVVLFFVDEALFS